MSEPEETHLLLYEYVENMAERRTDHREGHLAHLQAVRDAGNLVIAGAYGDPVSGGAIGFRGISREAVQEWVANDPYTLAGLVVDHQIHPWNLV